MGVYLFVNALFFISFLHEFKTQNQSRRFKCFIAVAEVVIFTTNFWRKYFNYLIFFISAAPISLNAT